MSKEALQSMPLLPMHYSEKVHRFDSLLSLVQAAPLTPMHPQVEQGQ